MSIQIDINVYYIVVGTRVPFLSIWPFDSRVTLFLIVLVAHTHQVLLAMFFMLNAGGTLLLLGCCGGRGDDPVARFLLTGRWQVRLVRGHCSPQFSLDSPSRQVYHLSIGPQPSTTITEIRIRTFPAMKTKEIDNDRNFSPSLYGSCTRGYTCV